MHRVTRGLILPMTASIFLLALAGAQPASGSDCVAHWASRSGSGTIADPYPVASTADLNAMRNCLSSHFKQIANISVGSIAPIGSDPGPFTGSYDGNGWELSNVTVSETGPFYAGFFGLALGATLTQISIVSGSISGGTFTGGLVGRAEDSEISVVSSSATVTGTDHVGGLIGLQLGGSLTDAYATGTVTGSGDYVGGLVGRIESSSTAKPNVTRAFATGNVSSPTGWDVAGLIGLVLRGTVSQTYATGATIGDVFVAGLVGELDGSAYGGFDEATVGDSFSSGIFTAGDPSSSGPLVGYEREPAEVTASSGKTTAEMKDASTYVGWNIGTTWTPTAVWVICSGFNNGYPHLAAFYTAANAPCILAPGSPSTPTITVGDGQVTATTAAGSGGTAATLQITAAPGGSTCSITGTSGSCTISGLTNGTTYTFTASATNSAGTSAASAASSGVSPRGSGGGGSGGGDSGDGTGTKDVPAPSPSPTQSPSPPPTPTAVPTAAPEPTPATENPGFAGALIGKGVYVPPADVALRVAPTLVPGIPSRNSRDAPLVAVARNSIVRLSARGFPPRITAKTFISIGGQWIQLGTSPVGKRGRTTLPAFTPTETGEFLARTSTSGTHERFVRIRVD